MYTMQSVYSMSEQFNCDSCEKTFQLYDQLKAHKRSMHSGSGEHKSFICEFCHKEFSQISSLRNHERTHTGEKPFQCLTCSKSFSQRGNLKHHERIHTGEKPFTCEMCAKAFSQVSSLRNHERTHTGEKPFTCPTCSKEFSQKGNLKIHERTHTGEKPFTCSLCTKSFSQKGNLKTHMRNHGDKKDFSCSICGKVFSCKSLLKCHEKAHIVSEAGSSQEIGTTMGQEAIGLVLNTTTATEGPAGSIDLRKELYNYNSNNSNHNHPGKVFSCKPLLKCHEKAHIVSEAGSSQGIGTAMGQEAIGLVLNTTTATEGPAGSIDLRKELYNYHSQNNHPQHTSATTSVQAQQPHLSQQLCNQTNFGANSSGFDPRDHLTASQLDLTTDNRHSQNSRVYV